MIRKISQVSRIQTEEEINLSISAYDGASICKFLNDNFRLGKLNIEVTYLLLFDDNLKLVYFTELSRGTHCASCVNLRIVTKLALMADIHFISLVHNHPNNDCAPSEEDVILTNSFKSLTNLSIHLISHIILTKSGYYDICSDESGEYETNDVVSALNRQP